MKVIKYEIEKLLPEYLSGEISDKNRAIIDEWRIASAENEALFREYVKAWEALPLLQEMEQFNSFEALKTVTRKISKPGPAAWKKTLQRIAAILLLPLLAYSGFLTIKNQILHRQAVENVVMQTIISKQSMVTQFTLADGTEVWLNSGSELKFPVRFNSKIREVILSGEAFFDVAKNEHQPFRVNAGELNIDVLGTSFDVINYHEDGQSEIILIEGKVGLSIYDGMEKKEFGTIHQGQRAVFDVDSRKVNMHDEDVDKYIAWRDGNLIFRDDSMETVAKRLSRWFNVEIIINDPEIENYIYTATFGNENLEQVLKLLKLSAPIDYQIVDREELPNNRFTKQKIYLMKKTK